MNNTELLNILFNIADIFVSKGVYIICSLMVLIPTIIPFIKSTRTLIKRLNTFEDIEATIVGFYDPTTKKEYYDRVKYDNFPILSYTVENKTYKHFYSLGVKKNIGEKVTIFCNTKNPKEIRFKALTFFNPIISLICFSMAIVLSIEFISQIK